MMASLRILFLLAYIVNPIICECIETNCDCIDYRPVFYQCPNSNNVKLVIQVGESNETKVDCHERISPDYLIPKKVFHPKYLTVKGCIVSELTTNILNFPNVEVLELNDLTVSESFTNFLFGAELSSLKQINFHNIRFDYSLLQYVNAPNLITMEFFENKIISMDGNFFKKLSNLKQIRLMYNSIEQLHNETFKGLENLEELDLGFNSIKLINRQVLRPLKSLIRVILQCNEGITLDDFLFTNFPQLSIIILSTSGLTSLPENLFLGSTNISEIYLNDNDISDIPRNLFKGLVNLKYIDLNNNHIKKLDNGLFQGLVTLKTLELNNNEITSISSYQFSGLSELADLRLNDNNISTIDENAFRTNMNLEKLHLSHNRYRYEVVLGKIFTSSPFKYCPFKYLDLSYNLMKNVPDDLFIQSRSLHFLNLEGNKIEILDLEDIQKWKDAFTNITINLQNNNISQFFFDQSVPKMIDSDYEDLVSSADKIVDTRKNSVVLKISGNPLVCDCYAENFADFIRTNSEIFFDLDSLRCALPLNMKKMRFLDVAPSELICDLQSITETEELCTNFENCSCIWRPFDKAIVVNCSSTNMTTVPSLKIPLELKYEKINVHFEDNLLTMFWPIEGYENVTGLFLGRNEINNVSWIPSNIETIDISNNNLTELSESVLNTLSTPSVKNIKMGNNSWSCSCDNYSMRRFLLENIKKIDAENIKCATTGTKFNYLVEEDFCDNTFFVIIKVFLSLCPIMISLILAVIYYKYKQEIRVWLYARNLCPGFFIEEDLDKQKKYDVFVSYSHKDAEFVEEQLVPILEGSYNYNLCLHYRDWIPGSFIAENICDSVANSKRTLIVLTPNFLESVWGKMEFRIAHTEAMKERRNRVILLLKEDIDTEKLDAELRSYISTNTYIKWGDSWFWKKLRYALPRCE